MNINILKHNNEIMQNKILKHNNEIMQNKILKQSLLAHST
jgi:hypothetical protein